jgi:hypothetical protein
MDLFKALKGLQKIKMMIISLEVIKKREEGSGPCLITIKRWKLRKKRKR